MLECVDLVCDIDASDLIRNATMSTFYHDIRAANVFWKNDDIFMMPKRQSTRTKDHPGKHDLGLLILDGGTPFRCNPSKHNAPGHSSRQKNQNLSPFYDLAHSLSPSSEKVLSAYLELYDYIIRLTEIYCAEPASFSIFLNIGIAIKDKLNYVRPQSSWAVPHLHGHILLWWKK